MKRRDLLTLVGAVCVVSLITMGLELNNRYSKNARVLETIDKGDNNGMIVFITEDGNTWAEDEVDLQGVNVGDNYKLTFRDTNEDGDIYNDEIVSFKKLLTSSDK